MSGASTAAAEMNLNRWVVFIGIVVVYFVISMFMDEIPLLLLTLQLTFPLITALGFDPIWFGVLSMLMVAMGLVFPPVGLLAFIVSATAGVDLMKVYKGCSILMLAIVLTTVLVMVFPLYNAIESLDRNQIEAARDLGAPWWKIHRDVVMPYAKRGIASGCTMVFMLSAGSLAAPQFLGGPSTLWFTSIVYDFFFQAFNWPRGAAYAFILLAACIAFVMLMLRLFKVSLGETIK